MVVTKATLCSDPQTQGCSNFRAFLQGEGSRHQVHQPRCYIPRRRVPEYLACMQGSWGPYKTETLISKTCEDIYMQSQIAV